MATISGVGGTRHFTPLTFCSVNDTLGLQCRLWSEKEAFEPPHVRVHFAGQQVRIELYGGTFMEEPPEEMGRKFEKCMQSTR